MKKVVLLVLWATNLRTVVKQVKLLSRMTQEKLIGLRRPSKSPTTASMTVNGPNLTSIGTIS